jgi:hypothetical protein
MLDRIPAGRRETFIDFFNQAILEVLSMRSCFSWGQRSGVCASSAKSCKTV